MIKSLKEQAIMSRILLCILIEKSHLQKKNSADFERKKKKKKRGYCPHGESNENSMAMPTCKAIKV